jgi:hypothetical protein
MGRAAGEKAFRDAVGEVGRREGAGRGEGVGEIQKEEEEMVGRDALLVLLAV